MNILEEYEGGSKRIYWRNRKVEVDENIGGIGR